MKSTHLSYTLEVSITAEVWPTNDMIYECTDDSILDMTTQPITNYDNFGNNISQRKNDTNHGHVATQRPIVGLQHEIELGLTQHLTHSI